MTQASSAIPMMPLYLSLLFKVMKEQGTHEGCIEQVDGLYRESLYGAEPRLDEEGRLRADYKELQPEVQSRVEELWDKVTNENLYELTDFAGYKSEFLNLFGFEVAGVDYEQDVNPDVQIANSDPGLRPGSEPSRDGSRSLNRRPGAGSRFSDRPPGRSVRRRGRPGSAARFPPGVRPSARVPQFSMITTLGRFSSGCILDAGDVQHAVAVAP